MGEVQLEILSRVLRDRFGLAASFGEGGILYRETIAAPSPRARGIMSRCATMPRYICCWSPASAAAACSFASRLPRRGAGARLAAADPDPPDGKDAILAC